MTRILPLILLALLAAAAPAGAATKHKFRADITIQQSTVWSSFWTTPVVCGDDYRHYFRGQGTGSAVYKAKGVPMVFQEFDGTWSTREFALPGNVRRSTTYSISDSGDPVGCADASTAFPAPPDTSGCGTRTIRKSFKSFWFSISEGRLTPIGTFTDRLGGDPFGETCPDQSGMSVFIEPVPSTSRLDVSQLIQDPSVTTIKLNSGRGSYGGTVSTDQMTYPDGEDHLGKGTFEGRWTVKLTRVR
jgi:hypothetical protein